MWFRSAQQRGDSRCDFAIILQIVRPTVRLDQEEYLGAGRKTRAPSYQERYLWLPLQATAGLADGRTYTGNLDLQSEVATEVELGLDFERSTFHLSPRLFYRDVADYIQGGESSSLAAVMFVHQEDMDLYAEGLRRAGRPE